MQSHFSITPTAALPSPSFFFFFPLNDMTAASSQILHRGGDQPSARRGGSAEPCVSAGTDAGAPRGTSLPARANNLSVGCIFAFPICKRGFLYMKFSDGGSALFPATLPGWGLLAADTGRQRLGHTLLLVSPSGQGMVSERWGRHLKQHGEMPGRPWWCSAVAPAAPTRVSIPGIWLTYRQQQSDHPPGRERSC